ncbi:MAG TPA: sensor histidine kinase [Spirochaetia bacterium]|nr:sensor histidine kinase [Spirochaetia bacterium]
MDSVAIPIILAISILLQVASAVTALHLIRVSGYLKPWLLISAAIVLMAIRRMITLYSMLATGVVPASSIGPELVALLISVLMLSGLMFLGPAFENIRRAEAESEREIQEGKMMVRESHHHIKNDLQMLASLVRLQIHTMPDDAARNLFQDLELRIRSFAMLHEEIYSSHDGDVQLSHYLRRLSLAIHSAYRTGGPPIDLEFQLEPIDANRKELLYCGLLLNEALTNVHKHAFTGDRIPNPRILVATRRDGDRRILSVTDNGVGLHRPGPGCTDLESSYGLTLIRVIGDSEDWKTSVTSPVIVAAPGEQTTGGGPGTRVALEF